MSTLSVRIAGIFHDSLRALGEICVRETGANSYAFSRSGEELLRGGTGAEGDFSVQYLLDGDDVLTLVFGDERAAKSADERIALLIPCIKAVWSARNDSEIYASLAGQVAELETRLMDTKIAERARGFLTDVNHCIPLDVLKRHVESVLKPTQTRLVLQGISRELQEEFEERQIVSRAKAILQSAQSMSEEEAHAYLRALSRKSRRRLKQVAEQVIEESKEIEFARGGHRSR